MRNIGGIHVIPCGDQTIRSTVVVDVIICVGQSSDSVFRIGRLDFHSFVQGFLEEKLASMDDGTFGSTLMNLHVNVESTASVPTRVDRSKVHGTSITGHLNTTKIGRVVSLRTLVLTGRFEVGVDALGITMPDLNTSSRYQLTIVGVDYGNLQVERESISGFSVKINL